MLKRYISSGLALVLALAMASGALAQGTQTGTLRGTVKTPDGEPVPGVLVTVNSPAIQGQRTTYTGATGEYIFRGLLPGEYTVNFELEGMTPVEGKATIQLGQVTELNAAMQVVAQEETIVVRGELPSVLASSEVSTTYNFESVNALPIGRTPVGIASLAPGLTTNTPNAGQVTISGGFAYDTVWLIDGVDANDNLFGSPNPVFIEDAIADTQVLTSGISAEYGRFTGGVINIITKSGGNEFSGTLRADLTNDDWRARTPLEIDRGIELEDQTSEVFSATVGGYVLKDRLWFFGAGRDEDISTTTNFPFTNLPRPTSQEEERFELKLTGNIANRHQLQAQATERDQTAVGPSFGFSVTPDTLRTRSDPNDLFVVRYSGVWTPSIFGEIQYSEKQFGFRNSHDFDDLRDSPFIDWESGTFAHYNRPYFDGTDPEDRDNEQFAASVSFFLDNPTWGSHDLKVGFEDFTSIRVGGNSQSTTDFVFGAAPLRDANGDFVVDANNKLIPVWTPGSTIAWNWVPTRGAKVELNTQSLYVNDRWKLNDHWSFNIGFRYEDVQGDATGAITTVDTSRLVPRLGATYDVRGDGKWRIDGTFAQYSGKYSETQFAENTPVGNPIGILLVYIGPPGQGLGHDPAFDIENNWIFITADVPTGNIVVDSDIESPVVDEWTLGVGRELRRGGYLKLVYTNREYSDFVEDFVLGDEAECQRRFGTSCVTDLILPPDAGFFGGRNLGVVNNQFISNSSIPTREYEALQLLGRYRIWDNWYVEGHVTYQLDNDGNFEGEATNQPGISSTFGDFPGVFFPERHFPTGRLNDYQEYKVRAWSVYNLGLGRAGNLTFGLLANYDSELTASTTAVIRMPFSDQQREALRNFATGPGATQTIFFGRRGNQEFDDALTFDASINYALRIWSDVELWIKTDVINIFNDDTQIGGFTQVRADLAGPTDEFGLPTEFTRPPNFRRPLNNGSFVTPRTMRFTVGFRF